MIAPLWLATGVSVAVAGWAALADRRQARRRDLDHVGIVPWPLALVLALMLAVVCAALALKGN